jgi:hypothetical protein
MRGIRVWFPRAGERRSEHTTGFAIRYLKSTNLILVTLLSLSWTYMAAIAESDRLFLKSARVDDPRYHLSAINSFCSVVLIYLPRF